MTLRDLPVQASRTRPRHISTGLRIGTHQVRSPKPARYAGKETGGLTSPSISHQCEYIQHLPRLFTRWFTVSPSQMEQSRTSARNLVSVNLCVRKYKVAPWWSASGDLTARTKGEDQPRVLHGGQPVEPLRAQAQHSVDSQELVCRPKQAGLLRSNQSHQVNPSRRGPHLPRRKRESPPVETSHSRPSNYFLGR